MVVVVVVVMVVVVVVVLEPLVEASPDEDTTLRAD